MPRTHPSDRWVRALRGGETVVDSRRALLVWRDRPYPSFAFPAEDVRGVESTPLQDVPGHVAIAWNAVDEWLEDDEPLVAHARDPFSRIDVRRSSRHVVIEHEGEVIADSRAHLLLYETGLPARFYLPPEDIRNLEPSPTRTLCAYKGEAEHLSHNGTDVAWVYRDPLLDAPRSRTGSASTPSAWTSPSTATAGASTHRVELRRGPLKPADGRGPEASHPVTSSARR